MQPSIRTPQFKRERSYALVLAVFVGFGLIVVGLLRLQVVQHEKYRELSKENSVRPDELPGIDIVVEPLRHYPHGMLAAHLLGYAGEVNDTELDSLSVQGYRPGDLIGRSGVERSYEDLLRGQDGAEFVVVNAGGQRVSTLSEGPPRLPVAGHDIRLTVDLKVQQALEDAMANVERGAAGAMDPRDGSILGLGSRPAFYPNEFSV